MQAVSLMVLIGISMVSVLELAIWIPVSGKSALTQALNVRLFFRFTQELKLLILVKYT